MVTDSELIMMIHNGNEELIGELINKNKNIISYVLAKYKCRLSNLGINEDDAYNEAIKALVIAINYYNTDKNVLFSTYYKMVLENKMKDLVIANSNRNKLLNEAILVSHNFERDGISIEQIAIDLNSNPSVMIDGKESISELIKESKKNLSSLEYKVLIMKINGHSDKDISKLLNENINHIYNAVYRIRCKIRKLLEKNT